MIQIRFLTVYDRYDQFESAINETLKELDEQGFSIRAVRFITTTKCAIEYAVPYEKEKEEKMTKPSYIDWPEEEKKKLAKAMAYDQIHNIFPPEANFYSDTVQGYFQGFSDGFLKALNIVEASTHAER